MFNKNVLRIVEDQLEHIRLELDLIRHRLGDPTEIALYEQLAKFNEVTKEILKTKTKIIESLKVQGILVKLKQNHVMYIDQRSYPTLSFQLRKKFNKDSNGRGLVIPKNTICVITSTYITERDFHYKVAVENPVSKKITPMSFILERIEFTTELTSEEYKQNEHLQGQVVMRHTKDNLNVLKKMATINNDYKKF